jgi:NAD(P)-dependent dehydrogenase (short-subunit alcohol dehydrogenase family)
MKPTILISGANRGIGLGLTREFLQNSYTVFATYRSKEKSNELLELAQQYDGHFHAIQCDVTSSDSIEKCFHAVDNVTKHLDILLNNAGVLVSGESSAELVTTDSMTASFMTNVVGALQMTQKFLPLIREGSTKKIIHTSSVMGSIERNSGGAYSYRISKAAMNQLSKTLAVDLRDEGITSIALHPGWVQTEMGGKDAHITVAESAAGLYQVITSATQEEHSGKFFDYQGEALPF